MKYKFLSLKINTVLILTIFFTLTNPIYALANADGTWSVMMEIIIGFIPKIGIILIVFGGIEFAIANSTEDVNQKLKATRFIVSGAIVLAVIEVLKPFLY